MKWIKNWLEELRSLPLGFTAFMTSVLFLLLGFFALFFAKTVLNVGQDAAVLVSVVLVPVLLYLILSGKLQEFSAGGLSAKFTDVARKPLDDSNADLIDAEEVKSTEKGGIGELQKKLQEVSKFRYVVLTLTLGKEGYYNTKALLDYLRAFSQHPNFKFLVILEQTGEVFAYISGWRAIQMLEMQLQSQENSFVDSMNEGRKTDLLGFGLVQATLRTTDTNINALKEMLDLKMDALVVTDNQRRLKGVVEREQVLSKLMLAISRSV